MPQKTDTATTNQLPLESEDNRRTHCGNDDDNIYLQLKEEMMECSQQHWNSMIRHVSSKSTRVIIEVLNSEWAIVLIMKKESSIWIYDDYKITPNNISKLDNYPIPKIEDLYSILAGGVQFTTLGIANAYLQMPLAEESRKYTTINTHVGLF